jgi:hypothetical protein
MAEITNNETGNLYLAVRLDVLRKEPELGMYSRGNVMMNSTMGLLWTEVAFYVGDTTIFAQEILLHSVDVRRFTSMVKELIANTPAQAPGTTRKVHFDDITSPELHIRVKQSIFAANLPGEDAGSSSSYELRVMVDPGIQNGSVGVAGEGPAMFLQPTEKDLLTFVRDWQSEAEMALLLG